MMAEACRKSAGTLTAWCGTKNDRIMNTPIAAVRNSGSSRFIGVGPGGSWLLGRQRVGEPVDAEALEHAPHDDDGDRAHLDEVRALERAHQPGIARQVRARGVELLADQRVGAG